MARLGLWDQGLSKPRFDASRGFIARRVLRCNGVDYAAGEPVKKAGLSKATIRRLFLTGRLAYGEQHAAEDGPEIPNDYARLPFFSLRKLASLISGQPIADKPTALDVVHAELMRRGRAT